MNGLSADAWAVWLAIDRAQAVAPIPRLAQESGIGAKGQGTTPKQRGRVADALAELEDDGRLSRNAGSYVITVPGRLE